MSWSSDTKHTSSWALVPDITDPETTTGIITLEYTFSIYTPKQVGIPLELDDDSVNSVFDPALFTTIVSGSSASSSNGTTWNGSLNNISPYRGYTLVPNSGASYPFTISITGTPNHNRATLEFSADQGQLISFPGCELSLEERDINTVFPASTNGHFDTITTLSSAASYSNGLWSGSLERLDPTAGYNLIASDSCPDDFSFEWNIPDFPPATTGMDSEYKFNYGWFKSNTGGDNNWTRQNNFSSSVEEDTTIASGWSPGVGSPVDGWTTLPAFNENFVEQEIYTNSFASEGAHSEGMDWDPLIEILIPVDGFFHTYNEPVEANNYFHNSIKAFTDTTGGWEWVKTG